MHTISGGSTSALPLVCLSGYGAGAGFYFRNLDKMAEHFRVHAVDLLGTGMSGGLLSMSLLLFVAPLELVVVSFCQASS